MAVPRDWLAGVKRALLGISPSKAGHECSRSVDASRAALRRPEVREQIEFFWSQAPPVPSELAVDEHAAQVAWRRAAPGASCATGGLDERGGLAGGPRSCCGRKSTPKGQPVSPPSMAQDVFRAVEVGGEDRQ